MIEPAIILVRLVQYAGAAILGGLPLFCLYGAPQLWPRGLLVGAAIVLGLAALLSIPLQASLLADSFGAGFSGEAIAPVVAYLPLGKAALARAALAFAAAATLLLVPAAKRAAAALGLLAAASLAWLGHAGAAESRVHLLADLAHTLTATIWLGALAGLCLVAAQDGDGGDLRLALRRFSAIGMPLVAVLVASGAVNGWYLIGPKHAADLGASSYGRLLALKLVLFAVMLGFAALHRYRADPGDMTLAELRVSLASEALLGLAVLALVAWLGTLEPPAG